MRIGSRLLSAAIAASMLLIACGGGANTPRGTKSCTGEPIDAASLELPDDFPVPSEAVLTGTAEAGPSQLVEGYYEGSLESAYEAWKQELEGAGFAILFDEIEAADSEISYESPDESATGQVALRSECKEAGRTSVRITNRPA